MLYKVDNAGIFTLIPKGAGANSWTQTNANSIAITLTDGGAFDLDGIANGVIVDPVAVGVPVAATPAATTSGGGGCNLNRSVSFDPMMLIMMILSLVYLVKTSKRKSK